MLKHGNRRPVEPSYTCCCCPCWSLVWCLVLRTLQVTPRCCVAPGSTLCAGEASVDVAAGVLDLPYFVLLAVLCTYIAAHRSVTAQKRQQITLAQAGTPLSILCGMCGTEAPNGLRFTSGPASFPGRQKAVLPVHSPVRHSAAAGGPGSRGSLCGAVRQLPAHQGLAAAHPAAHLQRLLLLPGHLCRVGRRQSAPEGPGESSSCTLLVRAWCYLHTCS